MHIFVESAIIIWKYTKNILHNMFNMFFSVARSIPRVPVNFVLSPCFFESKEKKTQATDRKMLFIYQLLNIFKSMNDFTKNECIDFVDI